MSEQTPPTEVVPVTKSEFVEEIEKTFELSELASALVSISNISGSVAVEAWDEPRVYIRAVKRARSQRSFDRTHVQLTQDGNQISARTTIDEEAIIAGVLDLLRGDRAGANVEYTVRAPADCAVRAKTVNGSVSLSGLSNRTEANSVNGSLRLMDLGGFSVASTVNGSLDGKGLSGDAELNTVNGSLTLVDARLNQLDARTVSGDIQADLRLDPSGTYGFNSTNGDCRLVLPADSRCTISMQAVNGGVECALPHSTIASEMRPAFSRWEAAINGGGVPLSFRTVNGRLRISAGAASAEARAATAERTDAAPMPSAPSEVASPNDSGGTMDVLRAVERGEISVDEAMRRIKRRA